MSNSKEMGLSATSFGEVVNDYSIYRKGAEEGYYIYTTDYIGLTPTAFKYFLEAKAKEWY